MENNKSLKIEFEWYQVYAVNIVSINLPSRVSV